MDLLKQVHEAVSTASFNELTRNVCGIIIQLITSGNGELTATDTTGGGATAERRATVDTSRFERRHPEREEAVRSVQRQVP